MRRTRDWSSTSGLPRWATRLGDPVDEWAGPFGTVQAGSVNNQASDVPAYTSTEVDYSGIQFKRPDNQWVTVAFSAANYSVVIDQDCYDESDFGSTGSHMETWTSDSFHLTC